MTSNDMQIYMDSNDMQAYEIPSEEIPTVISSVLNGVAESKKRVKKAKEEAKKAQESAEEASQKSAGFFKKKEAIESLQTATSDLSTSQSALVDAQEIMFQYQKELSKAMQYLFSIGTCNIAATRMVIRELKLRLEGASEEEISDLERNEIINVVRQLKEQEDMMNRQDALSKKVRTLELDLKDAKEKDEILSDQIQKQAQRVVRKNQKWTQKIEQQDKEIKTIKRKNTEYERLLEESAQKDKDHDKVLAQQMKKSEEHARLIAEQAAKDEELKKDIAQQLEKNHEYERLISKCEAQDNEQRSLIDVQAQSIENLLRRLDMQKKTMQEVQTDIAKLSNQINALVQEKSDKKQMIAAYVIGSIALIMVAIQFFI